MAQKLAIAILFFILVVVTGGVYWYVSHGSQPLFPTEPDFPSASVEQSAAPVSGDSQQGSASANGAVTSTKPMPSEAQIDAQVQVVLEKIKVEGKSRRLNTTELMYLANSRDAAIKDLTK